MKKFLVAAFLILLIPIFYFVWKIDVTIKVLNGYYTNIILLDPYERVKTQSEKKDDAYNFVYYIAADAIVQSRKTITGKIASDWIENKNNKVIFSRKESEKYLIEHDSRRQ